MTLIDASGRVLRDSHIAPDEVPELDNHNDRPEVEEARSGGQGSSVRYSNTLKIEAMNAALSLPDGKVLRVAVPLAEVRRNSLAERGAIGVCIAAVTAFCLALAVLISRRIHAGIADMAAVVESVSLGGGSRLHDAPGREFLPLVKAVNHMADEIDSYVGMTRDQQEQLEIILNSMHEGVLVLNRKGAIRRCNRALEALFPRVASAVGKQLIEGIPLPSLQRKVDDLLPGRGDPEAAPADPFPREEALHVEFPQGRFLVAHLSRPVEPNASLGAVIVFYDATELMRLERVRRDFVANVSHELRTPLTVIGGYAETLMDLEDIRPEYRDFAAIIHKHAGMLARVVTDLLALARVENSAEAIALRPTDALPCLQEALALCRVQAERKGLVFSLDMEPGLRVSANGPLLVQVFRNLLENACRYSPEGGEVRVAGKRQRDEALFTVSDTGPGIPPEDQARVFERFYQVEKQRNSATAGIGLALCRHIVERHGGRIRVESPFGDAATAVLFTLPAAGPAAKETEQ
jgi:two-component system phosphate regulon sensor histidine kinase PhoR